MTDIAESMYKENDWENDAHEKCLEVSPSTEIKVTLSDEELETIANFFYVMSDKTRLSIINLLEKGELCVGCIAKTLNLTQSAVSHQLALMKRMKLIKSKKDGRNIIYSLADGHINIVFDIAYEHISEK